MKRLTRALLMVLVVMAGACATADVPPSGTASTKPPAAEIRIGLTEWSIHTGGAVATAGEVSLIVTNAGGTVHDLVVDGRQGTWRTPMIDPGGRTTVDIETVPGETLALECSVPGHHESGMYGALDVVGSSP